jgi:hypothetical protein
LKQIEVNEHLLNDHMFHWIVINHYYFAHKN